MIPHFEKVRSLNIESFFNIRDFNKLFCEQSFFLSKNNHVKKNITISHVVIAKQVFAKRLLFPPARLSFSFNDSAKNNRRLEGKKYEKSENKLEDCWRYNQQI